LPKSSPQAKGLEKIHDLGEVTKYASKRKSTAEIVTFNPNFNWETVLSFKLNSLIPLHSISTSPFNLIPFKSLKRLPAFSQWGVGSRFASRV